MLADFHVLGGGVVGVREVAADGGWTLARQDCAELLGRLARELAEGRRAYGQGSGRLLVIVFYIMERSHAADATGRPALHLAHIATRICPLLPLFLQIRRRERLLFLRVADPMTLFAPLAVMSFGEARHADITERLGFFARFSERLQSLRCFLLSIFVVTS